MATMFSVGFAITFTVAVVTAVQELTDPVTVYTVEAAGVATTIEPVDALRLAEGLQVYVLAPTALSVAEAPAQMMLVPGVKVNEGSAFTVTLACATAVQVPIPPVTV